MPYTVGRCCGDLWCKGSNPLLSTVLTWYGELQKLEATYTGNMREGLAFYQMDRGLEPDGEVGPKTWGQLYEDVY